ncbi:hypothetical protein VHUM_00491 [Vanrija humicola]|uniref:Mitochondrial distribution and morphology protein 35 n=1 Tax=Vanrija humicola TaxID=5417 RepID=A0A7D8V6E8_VANHU|nr:hypothetical protein VHUM_00491 [Vanrija humicola]
MESPRVPASPRRPHTPTPTPTLTPAPRSLAEECTPLKQRYDSCFNLWFEGYLQQPLDTSGMTRAQIKAAEYERYCGAAWREYQGCLRKAIAANTNLTTLLDQAREEHPLHTMDGLEGTAWDPNNKGTAD